MKNDSRLSINCPFCGFSKEVSRERIPRGAKLATCPSCRQQFEFKLQGPSNFSPWEDRRNIGFWQGIYRTSSQVLLRPGLFFSTLKSRSGTGEAFSFGLLTGATGSMLGLFWQFLLLSGTISSHGFFSTGNTAMGVVFAIIIVLVPVFVALWMFVYSAILNFLLVLVGGAKCGFEGSFKVVAYSHAASLLSFIPFVGGLAGMIWQLVIQTIGLKEIHGITYLRLFAAGLIPLALVAVLGMALVLLI